MDQAKTGLVRKLFIKGRGAEILSKFSPPPILRDPFKVLVRLLVFWLTIWKPLGMAKMKIYCAFVKSGMRSVVVIGETVCVLYIHLWLEKPQQTPLRPIAIAGMTVCAQFPNARSILRSFSYWKMKDDNKKSSSHYWEPISNFFIALWPLPILKRNATAGAVCTFVAESLEGCQRMGGRPIFFWKSPRLTL
jgi:hypothetical protein